jgi:hypothetical protein
MKLEFPWQIFEKYSDIKFHENPSSGRRVVSCRRTDMTKLIVAFRNIANATKNKVMIIGLRVQICWPTSDLPNTNEESYPLDQCSVSYGKDP